MKKDDLGGVAKVENGGARVWEFSNGGAREFRGENEFLRREQVWFEQTSFQKCPSN